MIMLICQLIVAKQKIKAAKVHKYFIINYNKSNDKAFKKAYFHAFIRLLETLLDSD